MGLLSPGPPGGCSGQDGGPRCAPASTAAPRSRPARRRTGSVRRPAAPPPGRPQRRRPSRSPRCVSASTPRSTR
ncbi:hypothetical protein E9998_13140 [Glycomyces paridis]|uniref:Uncharacterized protein n=1 Tax=Glycomyces paridis TaxID=2126555 RepID=A0A4S8PC93_9ACTN|nr:hypothetical protein E9998_13140 [Glycomyces paridis]